MVERSKWHDSQSGAASGDDGCHCANCAIAARGDNDIGALLDRPPCSHRHHKSVRGFNNLGLPAMRAQKFQYGFTASESQFAVWACFRIQNEYSPQALHCIGMGGAIPFWS
jgi:hypothetical protein